jgi:hypothetical protein
MNKNIERLACITGVSQDHKCIDWLSYYDGSVRTYLPDAIDSRLMNPPVASTLRDAAKMIMSKNFPFMVPLSIATEISKDLIFSTG